MFRKFVHMGLFVLSLLFLDTATTYAQPQGTSTTVELAVPDYSAGCSSCVTIDGYYSARLRAQFLLERMAIPGYIFWGARITYLEPNSPLRRIGLIEGDVVTRLDGIRIGRNKYYIQTTPGAGYYALPQCERHHSNTQVRYIKTGTTTVRNGYTNLGPPSFPPPPSPLPPGTVPP